MELPDMQNAISIGALIALGTLVLTMQKIWKNFKKDRDEQEAKILQQAKEEDALLKTQMEAKIEALKVKVETLEHGIEKDMEHLRETYNGEIRNLGSKIEELRSELRNQHGQLVQLLSKMIENRE